jgi:hypothetical protein
MNLALTTIIVLLLASPGFIARSSYYKQKFNKQAIPKSMTEDVVRGLLYAMPIHLAVVFVWEHIHHRWWIGRDIDFETVFRILSGDYGSDGRLYKPIVSSLYSNIHLILSYFAAVIGFAFFGGHWLRNCVWKYQWDVRFPAVFGYRSDWLYFLFGRGEAPRGIQILPYADVIVEHPGQNKGTRIYRGVVLDFITDEDGKLTDLVLIETRRGKFEKQPDEKDRFYWEVIPGDYFIIKYEQVLNLNMTYEQITEELTGVSAASEELEPPPSEGPEAVQESGSIAS